MFFNQFSLIFIMEKINNQRKFSFFGDGSQFFGIYIVNLLLTVITLGIYWAWSHVANLKYLYQNTEFDGSRFEYHGTGKELFIGVLKALGILIVFYAVIFLLVTALGETAITIMILPIYFLVFLLMGYAQHASLKYHASRTSWRGIRFGYRGKGGEFMSMYLKNLLLTFLTLGIYGAWLSAKTTQYLTDNFRIGSVTFKYSGKGDDLLLIFIKGFLLSIITFGIYSFWFAIEQFNYQLKHTKAFQDGREITFTSTASGADLFGFSIINALITVFTLGFGTPWVMVRTMQFMCNHLTVEGDFRGSEITQTESDFNDAVGDGLDVMFS